MSLWIRALADGAKTGRINPLWAKRQLDQHRLACEEALKEPIFQAVAEVERCMTAYQFAKAGFEAAAWHQLQAAQERLRALLREQRGEVA